MRLLIAAVAVLAAVPAGAQTAATKTPAENPVTGGSGAAMGPNLAGQTLEPDAAAALDRMAAYMRTLGDFEVRSDSTMERVYADGQKLQFTNKVVYRVRQPDRMTVDVATDRSDFRILYNGSQMWVVAPKRGKYTSFAVSGSLSDVLARARSDFGLDFPLQDLFRWGSPSSQTPMPASGFKVGTSSIGGEPVSHYAFRQPGLDFQLWIADGDKPLPRKMVITSVDEPAQPQFTAYFTWNLKPQIADGEFSFKPGPDFKLVDFGAAPR